MTLTALILSGIVSIAYPYASPKVVSKVVGELSSPQCRGYDPFLILSMVGVESSFRARVESPTGDIGVGQLSPVALRELRLSSHSLDRSSIVPMCKYIASKRVWTQYHSKTPSRAKLYRTKVTKVMEGLRASMLKYQDARESFGFAHSVGRKRGATLAGVGSVFLMPVFVLRSRKRVSFKRKERGV